MQIHYVVPNDVVYNTKYIIMIIVIARYNYFVTYKEVLTDIAKSTYNLHACKIC